MMQFKNFSSSDEDDIKKWLSLIDTTCYEYQYSYYLLFGNFSKISIAFDDIAMYTYVKDLNGFLMPATTDLEKAITNLKNYCKENNVPFCIRAVPEEYILQFKNCTTILDRNLSDYLYTPENMIFLKGRHLQPKRNHINQFEKNYCYTFSPLTKDDLSLCSQFLTSWYEEHKDNNIGNEFIKEQNAINIAFDNLQNGTFIGEKLMVDDNLIGFTIGEIVNDNKMAIVHFEKADTAYIGSYPALNKHFAQNYLSQVEYINREEDMGLEGLRKAKLSYQPAKIGNKFTILP